MKIATDLHKKVLTQFCFNADFSINQNLDHISCFICQEDFSAKQIENTLTNVLKNNFRANNNNFELRISIFTDDLRDGALLLQAKVTAKENTKELKNSLSVIKCTYLYHDDKHPAKIIESLMPVSNKIEFLPVKITVILPIDISVIYLICFKKFLHREDPLAWNDANAEFMKINRELNSKTQLDNSAAIASNSYIYDFAVTKLTAFAGYLYSVSPMAQINRISQLILNLLIKYGVNTSTINQLTSVVTGTAVFCLSLDPYMAYATYNKILLRNYSPLYDLGESVSWTLGAALIYKQPSIAAKLAVTNFLFQVASTAARDLDSDFLSHINVNLFLSIAISLVNFIIDFYIDYDSGAKTLEYFLATLVSIGLAEVAWSKQEKSNNEDLQQEKVFSRLLLQLILFRLCVFSENLFCSYRNIQQAEKYLKLELNSFAAKDNVTSFSLQLHNSKLHFLFFDKKEFQYDLIWDRLGAMYKSQCNLNIISDSQGLIECGEAKEILQIKP